MHFLIILLAATTKTSSKTTSSAGLVGFLPLLLLIVVAYLLLFRPQRQRMRRQQEQLSQIQVGDEVVTIGGIVGRVTSMEGDRVWLELDEGVIVEFLRQAISRRLAPAEEVASPTRQAGSPDASSEDIVSSDIDPRAESFSLPHEEHHVEASGETGGEDSVERREAAQ
jgi:preprotein translocase subunit YajC